jgi:hypothetical protein
MYNKQRDLIDINQTGFREGLGCEVNILRIIENLRSRQQSINSRNTWIFFLDLKSAFDTVNHGILFDKMRSLGIDGDLVNSIDWFYRQTKF